MTERGHFEGKLHAFRRTLDGVVISYVVHPNDVTAEMATAALGTRYMMGYAAIGDDELPIPSGVKPTTRPKKDKRKFRELPASEQAGMLCEDKRFQRWLGLTEDITPVDSEDAASIVRLLCGVASRADINESNPTALERWQDLETRYRQHETDQLAEGRNA